jgi:hypothetical protein
MSTIENQPTPLPIGNVAPTLSKEEYTDYEEKMRDAIHKENELLNFRIQWLLTIQGFLFTALAISGQNQNRIWFGRCAASVGLFTCISFGFALYVGRKAFGAYLDRWNKIDALRPDDAQQIGVIGYLAGRWLVPFLPWRSLPVGLGLFWIVYAIALPRFADTMPPGTYQWIEPAKQTSVVDTTTGKPKP